MRLVKFQLPSRYSQLVHYLWSGKWQEADEETTNIMLQVARRKRQGYLDVKDIENFPCEDLLIIDQLWVYASKGRFGFSVQKKIFQSLSVTRKSIDKTWDDFTNCVGWSKKDRLVYYDELTFNCESASDGHLPYKHIAPNGHPVYFHGRSVDVINKFTSFMQRLVDCNI
ncbi:GUN4 domain-containing protein [Nostoc sp. UCD120]|nr:GUN4 domain-containing protein [Nostoc sp. UCD120]